MMREEFMTSVLGGVEGEEGGFKIEVLKDAAAGCEAVSRFAQADWWNWHCRSSLLFWRWSEGDQRRFARDGVEVFITSKLP